MAQYNDDGGWVGYFLKTLLDVLCTVIFGLFLISQWLTRVLFQHVLNPLLDGLPERHDGAVVLLAAGLWSVVAGGILFPLAWAGGEIARTGGELLQAWGWSCLFGLAWGVACGVWVLGTWWAEVERQGRVGYDVVRLLDKPLEIIQMAPTSPSALPQPAHSNGVPSAEELERLILGNLMEK